MVFVFSVFAGLLSRALYACLASLPVCYPARCWRRCVVAVRQSAVDEFASRQPSKHPMPLDPDLLHWQPFIAPPPPAPHHQDDRRYSAEVGGGGWAPFPPIFSRRPRGLRLLDNRHNVVLHITI